MSDRSEFFTSKSLEDIYEHLKKEYSWLLFDEEGNQLIVNIETAKERLEHARKYKKNGIANITMNYQKYSEGENEIFEMKID